MRTKITKAVLLVMFLTTTLSEAAVGHLNLSLDDYLCQVRKYNLDIAASVLIARGTKERAGEGKLIMQPSLFAEAEYLKNNYNPTWSPIAGNSSHLQTYKVGISQTTPYGLEGRVYYNYQHQTINGIPSLIPRNQATAASPILELDLPLSRNFAGRETRANAQLITSEALYSHYSERFKNTLLMAQAENTYWHLVILRNIMLKQRESLARVTKFQQWLAHRVGLRLAEEVDLFEANAHVNSKKLDIQVAANEIKIAELNFNTLRGACQTNVPETLCTLPQPAIACVERPRRPEIGSKQLNFRLGVEKRAPGVSTLVQEDASEENNNAENSSAKSLRWDVLAALEQEKIGIASAQLGIEKNKPNLELYASYALNGNNPSSNEAIAQSFSTNYPSTAIGLRLSMPLNLGRLRKDRAGYRKEMEAAKYQFQQKLYENQRLWDEVTLKILNAKKKLAIALQLEDIQLKKLQAEHERFTYGKTTTYQVLTSEQDYGNAQLASLSIQEEILQLLIELKTFGV
jgi:outer membrane protein TolC